MGYTAVFSQHTTLTAYYRAFHLVIYFRLLVFVLPVHDPHTCLNYSFFAFVQNPLPAFLMLALCVLYYLCTGVLLAHWPFPPSSCMLSNRININSMYDTSSTLSIHFVSFLVCVGLVSYYITEKNLIDIVLYSWNTSGEGDIVAGGPQYACEWSLESTAFT